jgi:TRAP-type C4-dicarboxylate transport system permease large subunit
MLSITIDRSDERSKRLIFIDIGGFQSLGQWSGLRRAGVQATLGAGQTSLLTMPIFVPIIIQMGMDPVWFGFLFAMNMQVSYLSPPFGPAAFYLKAVAPDDMSLAEIFKALLPFIAIQIVALSLVLFFPEIGLWLPNKF